jgi:hypothetical protein
VVPRAAHPEPHERPDAFLLDVTDEFYTMGFVPEVIALLPNATVANGGNYTTPDPPASLWALFWNAVAGFASAVWDAAVAVAQFMIHVVKFLVNIVVGLVIALLTGDWTYFQDNVVEPFVSSTPLERMIVHANIARLALLTMLVGN